MLRKTSSPLNAKLPTICIVTESTTQVPVNTAIGSRRARSRRARAPNQRPDALLLRSNALSEQRTETLPVAMNSTLTKPSARSARPASPALAPLDSSAPARRPRPRRRRACPAASRRWPRWRRRRRRARRRHLVIQLVRRRMRQPRKGEQGQDAHDSYWWSCGCCPAAATERLRGNKIFPAVIRYN